MKIIDSWGFKEDEYCHAGECNNILKYYPGIDKEYYKKVDILIECLNCCLLFCEDCCEGFRNNNEGRCIRCNAPSFTHFKSSK